MANWRQTPARGWDSFPGCIVCPPFLSRSSGPEVADWVCLPLSDVVPLPTWYFITRSGVCYTDTLLLPLLLKQFREWILTYVTTCVFYILVSLWILNFLQPETKLVSNEGKGKSLLQSGTVWAYINHRLHKEHLLWTPGWSTTQTCSICIYLGYKFRSWLDANHC